MTIKRPTRLTLDTQWRIDGTPALLQAGEFHYFRLPHPNLWAAVLQRMRGGGLNTVVIPFPWAYHSPAAGWYDFTGPRDLQRLLDEVEAAGLWLIAAIGPWNQVNLNAGGLPAWFVNMPGVLPNCAGDVPPGPSFAFLHHVREWWERLLPFLIERPNLLLLAIDPGPCSQNEGLPRYQRALLEMAGKLGAAGPYGVAHGDPNADAPITSWHHLSRDDLLEDVNLPEGFLTLTIAPPFTWATESRERLLRQLGAEHPRLPLGRLLGRGATHYALEPAHAGVQWGYWGMAEACAAYGVGALLGEGGMPTAAYFQARRMLLAAETLGRPLTTAQPTSTVYSSISRALHAARTADTATVAFLEAVNTPIPEIRLALPHGDEMLNTASFALAAESACVLPLQWQIPGGQVWTTTLEAVLMLTVAGRHLLVLTNENGGDLLLGEDFRPQHARGAVRTQRTDAGLAVHFAAGRWASLLLAGPAGTVQLLALEPRLAARVWPLDDTWRTTPTYPAVWQPAPEAPARGLVIGPEWVLPHPDGSYTYLAGEKGIGYRWGPWRGSDPHTWLTPLAWPEAPAVTLPTLTWESRPAAPEVSPAYDDSHWTAILLGATPPAEYAADGFTWYRGHFDGPAGQLTLTCDPTSDVFLNGTLIAALNTPPWAVRGTAKILPLPQHLLRNHNTLAILVENLGQQQDWESAARARGLVACSLDNNTPIYWRARRGLSGERSVQGFSGYADWSLVPADGSAHITWHRAVFTLALPDDVETPLFLFLDQMPGRAYIYLNGQLIGRYTDSRAPQHRFWLPEGLLHRTGENEILIAQWTRGAQPGHGLTRLEHGAILQWHR